MRNNKTKIDMEEIINSFENGQSRYLECHYFRNVVNNIYNGSTEKQLIISLINIMKEQDTKFADILNFVNYNASSNTISMKESIGLDLYQDVKKLHDRIENICDHFKIDF